MHQSSIMPLNRGCDTVSQPSTAAAAGPAAHETNTDMSAFEDEITAAVRAVTMAARLTRDVQERLVDEQVLIKKDRSPVTVADYGAQAIVSRILRQHFPSIPIVGEETAADLRQGSAATLLSQVMTSFSAVLGNTNADTVLEAIDACSDAGGATGRRWVLDPIDGTKGFLRGEQYAIALALLDDGQPVLGVLGCPNLAAESSRPAGTLFVAAQGRGCRQQALDSSAQATPAEVATCTDSRQASFCESVESAHSAHDRSAAIARLLGVESPPVRMDSQCKYGAVARGQAEIYLRLPKDATYQEKIWDHAAGAVVVAEAGGRVTDIDGQPLDFSCGRTLSRNRGIIATNGHLHDQVLEAVSATEVPTN